MGIQLALTPTRQFNHFDEKEVENTVFHSTYNARISKCKQQKRRIAKTLGVPCNGLYVPSGKEAFTLVDFVQSLPYLSRNFAVILSIV